MIIYHALVMTRIICLAFLVAIASSAYGQNTGIGTLNPKNTLHVVPEPSNPVQDPIRIENLQLYQSGSDTSVLVVQPDSGVIRYMPISALGTGGGSGSIQTSSQVPLSSAIDVDGDGALETNVQEALILLSQRMPRGIYKSYGEARAAGLLDGDCFIADPAGIFGCPGCILELKPGMN